VLDDGELPVPSPSSPRRPDCQKERQGVLPSVPLSPAELCGGELRQRLHERDAPSIRSI
jgi:hypothetical protein